MTTRRWETDARGHGMSSGEACAGNLRGLAALMADPGWVAEDADAHLLPHLRIPASPTTRPAPSSLSPQRVDPGVER